VVGAQEAAVQPVGLLGAHQNALDHAAYQHDEGQHDIHDADLLVVDRAEPIVPQRLPPAHVGQQCEDEDPAQHDRPGGAREDDQVGADRMKENLQRVDGVKGQTPEEK